jgi:hypothetical protein
MAAHAVIAYLSVSAAGTNNAVRPVAIKYALRASSVAKAFSHRPTVIGERAWPF